MTSWLSNSSFVSLTSGFKEQLTAVAKEARDFGNDVIAAANANEDNVEIYEDVSMEYATLNNEKEVIRSIDEDASEINAISVVDLQNELNRRQSEIDTLEQRLLSAHSVEETTLDTLASHEKAMIALRNDNHTLRAELEHVNAVAAATAATSRGMSELPSSVSEEIRNFDDAIFSQLQVNQLAAELSVARALIERLKGEKHDDYTGGTELTIREGHRAEIAHLVSEQMNQLSAQAQAHSEAYNVVQSENVELREHLQRLDAELTSMEGGKTLERLRASENECKRMESTLAELDEAHQLEMEQLVLVNKEQIRMLELKLQSELIEYTDTANDTVNNQERSEMEREISGLRSELKLTIALVEQRDQMAMEANTKASNAFTVAAEAEALVQQIRAEADSLKMMIHDRDTEVTKLKQQIDEMILDKERAGIVHAAALDESILRANESECHAENAIEQLAKAKTEAVDTQNSLLEDITNMKERLLHESKIRLQFEQANSASEEKVAVLQSELQSREKYLADLIVHQRELEKVCSIDDNENENENELQQVRLLTESFDRCNGLVELRDAAGETARNLKLRVETLMSDKVTLQEELRMLELSLNRQKGDTELWITKMSKLEDAMEAMRVENGTIHDALAQKNVLINTANMEVKSLRDRIATLESMHYDVSSAAAVAAASSFEEERNILMEKLERAEAELARLREHLMESEELHTAEVVEVQSRVDELEDALKIAQTERASADSAGRSSHEQISTTLMLVRQELAVTTRERDESLIRERAALAEVAELTSGLENLQSVVEQVQDAQDCAVAAGIAEQKDLMQQLRENASLSEKRAVDALAAADEFRTAADAAEELRNVVRQRELEIARLCGDVRQLETLLQTSNERWDRAMISSDSSMVDKSIIKSLILKMLKSPSHRADILHVLEGLLDFTPEEKAHIGASGTTYGNHQPGWRSLGGMLPSILPPLAERPKGPESGKSFSESFVSFLLHEIGEGDSGSESKRNEPSIEKLTLVGSPVTQEGSSPFDVKDIPQEPSIPDSLPLTPPDLESNLRNGRVYRKDEPVVVTANTVNNLQDLVEGL